MYDLTINKNFTVGNKQYSHNQTLSKGGLEAIERPIPIAWAGVLTTRTDDDTGTITMNSASHLIETGAIVDIYWTNADGTHGSRRGVTVGTVATTSVPFGAGVDIGAGDPLPIATTVVQVATVQSFTQSITGDDVAALVAAADSTKATIVLLGTGGTVEHLAISISSGGAYGWTEGEGTNPIAGDVIDTINMTIADTATVRNARLAALMDI